MARTLAAVLSGWILSVACNSAADAREHGRVLHVEFDRIPAPPEAVVVRRDDFYKAGSAVVAAAYRLSWDDNMIRDYYSARLAEQSWREVGRVSKTGVDATCYKKQEYVATFSYATDQSLGWTYGLSFIWGGTCP